MVVQVLIATLGTEPQTVPLTLDLLQAKGYSISEVIVVHTSGEAVRPALKVLREEFERLGGCVYRPVVIEGERGRVSDILTESDTAALLRTLYRTVLAEKRAGRCTWILLLSENRWRSMGWW